ncbi:MAG TPA: deoxyribonuclease I [Methylophaga aminisulfidivorans]|uniref:Deoxyribonuclease I n=2 Tax=root TaxID=1 RepID=A0A7C1VSF1_9GAMM|nr:deoxyribonuclease I [Methylophaga aminisulfidivorans]
MNKKTIWLIAGLIMSLHAFAAPDSFVDAKAELRSFVYFDQNHNGAAGTLYCGCDWDWHGRSGGTINAKKCGYQVRKQRTRGARIEYEHIVSAYNFGRARQCWQKGGRKYCQKNDDVFRMMEADMHNLSPAVGELNADRSNYRFGVLPDTESKHGACPFKVDFKARVAEPRPEVRGFIARVQFYMHDRYNLPMSRQQQQLYMVWNKQYPPSVWELERDKRIAVRMGNHNPFVTGQKVWSLGYKNSGDGINSDSKQMSAAPTEIGSGLTIRGNRNSKVYHLPKGCPSYEKVSPRNIVPFSSEIDAQNAGFRKAGNCK